MNNQEEEIYEQDNVPQYTEQEVDEIIRSVSQHPQVNRPQVGGMDPDLLAMLINKKEFEGTELLSPRMKKVASFFNSTVSLSNTRREDFFHYRERLKDAKVVEMISRRPSEFT